MKVLPFTLILNFLRHTLQSEPVFSQCFKFIQYYAMSYVKKCLCYKFANKL